LPLFSLGFCEEDTADYINIRRDWRRRAPRIELMKNLRENGGSQIYGKNGILGGTAIAFENI
jgi:hypothetical protein